MGGADTVRAAGLIGKPVAEQGTYGDRARSGEVGGRGAWRVGHTMGPGQAGDGIGIGPFTSDSVQGCVAIGGYPAVVGRDAIVLGEAAEDVDDARVPRGMLVAAAGRGEAGWCAQRLFDDPRRGCQRPGDAGRQVLARQIARTQRAGKL